LVNYQVGLPELISYGPEKGIECWNRMKPSYGRTVPGWAPIAVLAFKDFAHNSQALLQTLQLLERLAVFMLVCGWTGKQHDDCYKAILDDWDSATSLARHSSSADLWRGTP
jgi:hypothetical protein